MNWKIAMMIKQQIATPPDRIVILILILLP